MKTVPASPTPVPKLNLKTPVIDPADEKLEAEGHFTARIEDLKVTDCTAVRCRYEWWFELGNEEPKIQGFGDPSNFSIRMDMLSEGFTLSG